MESQPGLLFDAIEKTFTIQERFEAFIAANPHVFGLFKRFARQARDAGRKRYSAEAILQRIRWHMDIEVNVSEGEKFKINDHYRSRLSRKLVQEDPSFEGFFEMRELKAE